MVEIIPFRGIRYSKKIDLSKVVTPPYDVISKGVREEYYNSHENNVIRLILGKEFPGDDSENNKYTRARDYFENWIRGEILKQDAKEAIYVYEQEYLHKGQKNRLRGFIALVRIEEFEKGIILPHEETLQKSVADRLELMRATNANLSPIYALYSDPTRGIDELLGRMKQTTIEVELHDIRHRLWKVSNADIIKKVKEAMKDKKLFIADGHHRYETALRFRNEMRRKSKSSDREPYNYVMMFLANMDSGGITILPAHRLVSAPINLRSVKRYFDVETLDSKNKMEEMFEKMKLIGSSGHAFGMYCGENKYCVLTLKDEKIMDKIIKGKSQEWKKLDVAILHALLLNIEGVEYVIDEKRAVQLVDEGKYKLAFFLNPTKVEQVKEVALANEKMPGKATYFYPKLLTGLVLHKLT